MKVVRLLVAVLVISALSLVPLPNHIAVNAAMTPTPVNISIYKGAGAGPEGAPGYSPNEVSVIIGTNNTIIWKNNDVTLHTATAFGATTDAPPPFDTGVLSPNQIAEPITIDNPGDYPYFCRFHQWMRGTVHVLPEGSTIPPPTKTAPTPSPTQPTVIATSPTPPATQTTTTPKTTTTTLTQTSTPAPTPTEKKTATPTLTQTQTITPQKQAPTTQTPITTPPTTQSIPTATVPTSVPSQAAGNQIPIGIVAIIVVIIVVVIGVALAVYRRKR